RFAALQVVEERTDGHARTDENWSTSKDFRVAMPDLRFSNHQALSSSVYAPLRHASRRGGESALFARSGGQSDERFPRYFPLSFQACSLLDEPLTIAPFAP